LYAHREVHVSKVTLSSVTKRFGTTVAVDDLTLDVHEGEFLVLLGPSGCGKSTALRMIAGLETVSAGEIAIGDTVVNDVPPRLRDIAMVFQSYALYPHLTVRKNVEFPLRQRKMDKDELARRVDDALNILSLSELADRKPGQLSGGQRQRVALARAIVREPQVFLMDEPLSNLDAKLRLQTRADIVSLQRRLGTTMIYVTHDQVEAMTMGHRIAVMEQGRLQQIGRPIDLYNQPANAFVARFLGSPGMNLLTGSIAGGVVRVGGHEVAATQRGDLEKVSVGIRAEDARLADDGVECTVVVVEDLGADVHVVCDTADGERIIVKAHAGANRPDIGDTVHVSSPGDRLHFFDVATGARLP
jgi:multiple sugar transport system ATP-binding protein